MQGVGGEGMGDMVMGWGHGEVVRGWGAGGCLGIA